MLLSSYGAAPTKMQGKASGAWRETRGWGCESVCVWGGVAPSLLALCPVWRLLVHFRPQRTQPQQQAVWMRARPGLWPSTGWEVTLVTSLPSLQEESMKEKKLLLY